MSEAPSTEPAPPPSEPPVAIQLPPAPLTPSAYELRIDELLASIEAHSELAAKRAEEASAHAKTGASDAHLARVAAEAALAQAGFCRSEISEVNGKVSAIQTAVDLIAADVADIKGIVVELRAGFAEIYRRTVPPQQGSASPAQEHVATVHPLRGADQ